MKKSLLSLRALWVCEWASWERQRCLGWKFLWDSVLWKILFIFSIARTFALCILQKGSRIVFELNARLSWKVWRICRWDQRRGEEMRIMRWPINVLVTGGSPLLSLSKLSMIFWIFDAPRVEFNFVCFIIKNRPWLG